MSNNKTNATTKFYINQVNKLADVILNALQKIYYKTFNDCFDVFMGGLWIKNGNNPAILDQNVLEKNETVQQLESIDWKSLDGNEIQKWLNRMDLQTLLKAIRYRPDALRVFCEKNILNEESTISVFQGMINWRNYSIGHQSVYQYENMSDDVFKLKILEPAWELYELLARNNSDESASLKETLQFIELRMAEPSINVNQLVKETKRTENAVRDALNELQVYFDDLGEIKGENEKELVKSIKKIAKKDNIFKRIYFKDTENGKKLSLIAVTITVLLCALIVAGVLYFNRFNKVDASKYMKIKVEKTINGHSKAKYIVDFDGLAKEILDNSNYENNKTINGSYSKIRKKIAEKYLKSHVGKKTDIANGDYLTMKIDWNKEKIEELGVELINTELSEKVSGIKEAKKIDPFKDIRFLAKGRHPYMEVTIYNNKKTIPDDAYMITNIPNTDKDFYTGEIIQTGFRIGETLLIKIDDKIVKNCLEKGYELTSTRAIKKLKVPFLEEAEEINEDNFKSINKKCIECFKGEKDIYTESAYGLKVAGYAVDCKKDGGNTIGNSVCVLLSYNLREKGKVYECYRILEVENVMLNKFNVYEYDETLNVNGIHSLDHTGYHGIAGVQEVNSGYEYLEEEEKKSHHLTKTNGWNEIYKKVKDIKVKEPWMQG